ncbi:hypothetical protein LIHA111178_07775 [Litorimonas haliclonae]
MNLHIAAAILPLYVNVNGFMGMNIQGVFSIDH